MDDFIMEFLDWLADTWNCVIDSARNIAKVILAVLVAILTMPVWILPFGVWLVFVKLKGGKDHG